MYKMLNKFYAPSTKKGTTLQFSDFPLNMIVKFRDKLAKKMKMFRVFGLIIKIYVGVEFGE